ncbi:hypothetical protein AB0H43_20445 [Hamadaea sp. NPDC050747]
MRGVQIVSRKVSGTEVKTRGGQQFRIAQRGDRPAEVDSQGYP